MSDHLTHLDDLVRVARSTVDIAKTAKRGGK
jgi:hypothetical protein